MELDLSTTYLGLPLRNPLVISACPLTAQPETLRQLVCCGAAAAVLPSIFEEQIEKNEAESEPEAVKPPLEFPLAMTYRPAMEAYNGGPEAYLQMVRRAKSTVDIPIIASMNGMVRGDWLRYAQRLAEAGADAIELNLYRLPMHPHETADAIEDDLVATVEELHRLVSIPIAVKLTPYFTSLPHLTTRLVDAGAAGIVLFGRYPEPDIDLGRSGIEVHWPLTRPSDIGHTLRWVGLLRPHLHPHSLAACGGVENSEDALKMLMAGADVVMIASVLYRHGPDAVRSILDGIRQWASHSGSDTLRDWVGAKVKILNAYPQAAERAAMTGSLLHAAEHTAEEDRVE